MSQLKRRRFVVAGAATLCAPVIAFAQVQQQGKVWRIGFLFAGALAQRPQTQGLWQGLQELGYTPGKNIVVDTREAEGKFERLPDLARELVALKPDVIVAVTPAAITAAQKATTSIPIVMAVTANPIGFGNVRNPARPEGNVTGTTIAFDHLATNKRLQLLKEMLPTAFRFAAIFNHSGAGVNVGIFRELEKTAASLGVQLLSLPFHGPNDLESAFAVAARERPQGLIVLVDPVTSDKRTAIIAFAAAERIPTIYGFADEALEGGLVGFGVNLREEYRRAAAYVDKILKGAKPGDLPVQQSSKVELVVNLRTARQLGITVPQVVLVRADRVIE